MRVDARGKSLQCVRARARQVGQASGTLMASHFANAGLTSTGRSWAIQWPEGTTTSVGAVAAHRFGEAGVDRFAGIVVGAVQEEHRESEFAAVLRVGGISDVGGAIHVPGVRAEEAGGPQAR